MLRTVAALGFRFRGGHEHYIIYFIIIIHNYNTIFFMNWGGGYSSPLKPPLAIKHGQSNMIQKVSSEKKNIVKPINPWLQAESNILYLDTN